MSKVKICGIRRQQDIEYVNRLLPDYIGFIFAESKRRVDIETAKALSGALDDRIEKVGVFVNEAPHAILNIAVQCRLNAVQIHGNETPDYVEGLRRLLDEKGKGVMEIWRAIRVKDRASIEEMKAYRVEAFVLDAYAEGAYGGIGKAFDWSLAAEAKEYGKIFMAGGLNAQNVRKAIEQVKPYGVDTSSGVETEGFKDEEKIREFIYQVRNSSGF